MLTRSKICFTNFWSLKGGCRDNSVGPAFIMKKFYVKCLGEICLVVSFYDYNIHVNNVETMLCKLTLIKQNMNKI